MDNSRDKKADLSEAERARLFKKMAEKKPPQIPTMAAKPLPPLPSSVVKPEPPKPEKALPALHKDRSQCEEEYALMRLRVVTIEKGVADLTKKKLISADVASALFNVCANIKIKLNQAIKSYNTEKTKTHSVVHDLITAIKNVATDLDSAIRKAQGENRVESMFGNPAGKFLGQMKTGMPGVEALRAKIKESEAAIAPKPGHKNK